jgi:hypothetical protein
VNRVDRDVIDGVDVRYVGLWWITMAFEREVEAVEP